MGFALIHGCVCVVGFASSCSMSYPVCIELKGFDNLIVCFLLKHILFVKRSAETDCNLDGDCGWVWFTFPWA